MLEKSRLLIVDPHTESRMKIKAVASAFMRVEKIMQSMTPRDALERIGDNDPFDIVFISSTFNPNVIGSFVAQAKLSPNGRVTAFILLVQVRDQESSYIVNNIMQGVDGFVLEPLSVDSFIEVVRSAREKAQDGPIEIDDQKKKALMKFLMSDAIQQIDKSAAKLSIGSSPGYAMKDLKETSSKLAILAEDLFSEYTELLITTFGGLPAPTPVKNKIKRKAKEEKKVAQQEQKQQGYFIRKR